MFRILISTCIFCLICFILYFVKKNIKTLYICSIWNISSLACLFYQTFDIIEYIIVGTIELLFLLISLILSFKNNKIEKNKISDMYNSNIQTSQSLIDKNQEKNCVTDIGLCKIFNENDENIVIKLSNNNNIYDFSVKDGQIVAFIDELTGKTIKF